jgi:hypothetical protein
VTVSEQRIEAALARLGAEYEPLLGWQARVLAAIEPARRPWWSYAMPAAAVAATALCVLQFRTAVPALAIRVDIAHRATVRGSEARVGDTVHLAVSGGSGERALWLYRDERRLVLRCPGDPVCAMTDAGIAVSLELADVGNYTVVALAVDGAPPEPAGSYDDDTAAARRARIAIHEDRFSVR